MQGKKVAAVSELATRGDATAAVGLVVGFSALVMTFAAMLLAYGMVRLQAGAWPPPGEPHLPGFMWPWLAWASGAAGAASATLWGAGRAFDLGDRAHRPGRARLGWSWFGLAIGATAVLELLFVAVQVSGAMRLLELGIRPSAGIAVSVVFALTGFHAAHALAAAVAVSVLGARVLVGAEVRRSTLTSIAAFGHLVTLLWFVVCALVFVA